MVIELSNLTFTDQDDIVPESGWAPILNTGIVNTLAGNDSITGSGIGNDDDGLDLDYGFKNLGVLNTDDGNDTITGSVTYGRFGGPGYNIINFGTLNTGEGNDLIDGSYGNPGSYAVYSGIYNPGTLNTGGGDDTITAYGSEDGFINEAGTVNTGEGNDIIIASGGYSSSYGIGMSIWDGGTINTGNGEDSIISEGNFYNSGGLFLGDGNDTINSGSILYNGGVIETGNGDDSIVVNGGSDYDGTTYGIKNNGGAINMGDGNDSIIAYESFESAENSSGAWFLGEGEDYIKGYGSGDFYGGNGNDTLELTPGSYTVGIWGQDQDTSVIFTKGNSLMITSEFEQLIAGGTTYNFANLTAGQTIVVA